MHIGEMDRLAGKPHRAMRRPQADDAFQKFGATGATAEEAALVAE
jgi:hypothetical protein